MKHKFLSREKNYHCTPFTQEFCHITLLRENRIMHQLFLGFYQVRRHDLYSYVFSYFCMLYQMQFSLPILIIDARSWNSRLFWWVALANTSCHYSSKLILTIGNSTIANSLRNTSRAKCGIERISVSAFLYSFDGGSKLYLPLD